MGQFHIVDDLLVIGQIWVVVHEVWVFTHSHKCADSVMLVEMCIEFPHDHLHRRQFGCVDLDKGGRTIGALRGHGPQA